MPSIENIASEKKLFTGLRAARNNFEIRPIKELK